MCRLYGFRATHVTEVQCELVEAQNSLIRQSEEDARGLVNDDGWGIGLVRDGELECEREVQPASEDEEFRRDAMDAAARTVLAHVRRATVGHPAVQNTHPFRYRRSMLIHNGHLEAFRQIRLEMMGEMREENRKAIAGTTDSEHFFQLLLSRRAGRPGASRCEVLRDTIEEVRGWSREVDPRAEVALNVLWTTGEELAGSRLGRSLWYIERDGPHRCEVCGQLHPDPSTLDGEDYRAVVVASERITDEDWVEVPEGSVFSVDGEMRLEVEPL